MERSRLQIRKIYDVALRKISMTRVGAYFITPPLYSLSIEPTNSCNLNCVMCYSDKRNQGLMSWQLFTDIVDEISSRKDIGVGLNFGGESLVHPRFKDMLEYLSSKGVENIGFNSNGMLLTPKIAEAFLNYSKGAITFSLDGLEETYTKIRIGANYQRVIQNIESLLEMRKQKGLSKPLVAVNLVKCDQSQQEINDYIKYWIDKVDYVSITEQLDSNLKIVSKDEAISQQLQKGRALCLWSWRYLAIYWDGRITLCCHDLDGLAAIDANATEGIRKVWKGNKYSHIRRRHLNKDYSTLGLCSSCEAWISTYLPSKLSKTDDGVYIWKKGLSAYYTKKPETLGIKP